MVQLLWNTVWRFLKQLNIELPYDPAVPLLGIYLGETKTYVHTKSHMGILIAALFIKAKMWKQAKGINTLWSVRTMEYYSAIQRSEVLIHVTTWMNLENMILGERIQSEDHVSYDSIHMKYLHWGNPQRHRGGWCLLSGSDWGLGDHVGWVMTAKGSGFLFFWGGVVGGWLLIKIS